MSSDAYLGTQRRTFAAALLHLLEHDYGLLGSRRVLQLLVADVQHLIEQFFPAPERLASGWLVFTGTKAAGSKAFPGQTATDLTLVTLAWPVLLPEDIAVMASGPDSQAKRRHLTQQRLVRLIEYGWQHADGPVLLILADLALMLGLSTVEVSHLLQQARAETGKPLLTKGYFFDQGLRPTHKAEVIALYEQGKDEAEIARLTQHAQTSVGHYIRDYERVKLLVGQQQDPHAIPRLLDMRPTVVAAYLALVRQFHPHLLAGSDANHDSP